MWFALSLFIHQFILFWAEELVWWLEFQSDLLLFLSLSVISLLLSLFWGLSILEKIKEAQLDITSILFYVFLQFLCFVLLEERWIILSSHIQPKKISQRKIWWAFCLQNQIGIKRLFYFIRRNKKPKFNIQKQNLTEEILKHKTLVKEFINWRLKIINFWKLQTSILKFGIPLI